MSNSSTFTIWRNKLKQILIITLILFLSPSWLFSQERYGLIIGTNYKGNTGKIPELDLCERDAEYLKKQIDKVGKFKEIRVLLGRQVTKENVQKEFQALANKVKKDDTVFLYFSGHGTTQRDAKAPNGLRNLLICYDRPHISDDELNNYLEKIKSPKTLFVLDCCYSGGIAKKGLSTRGAAAIPIPEGSDGIVKQNAEDYYFQNKAVISSSDDNETSIEVGGSINHGVFTYNFGRALESADLNGDKVVTALEAFFVSKQETTKMAKRFNHDQNPQISGNASGVFLSGQPAPVVPATPVKPPTNIAQPLPPPVSPPAPIATIPPVATPVTPPTVVTPVEPPAPPVKNKGDILIKTTIVRAKELSSNKGQNPYDLLKRQGLPSNSKNKDGSKESSLRNIKVTIDGEEYPSQVMAVKSPIWGASTLNGKLVPGEVYHIRVKNIATGIHQVKVEADEYPQFETAVGVLPNQDNIVDVTSSITGYGAIEGRVFYKTLDNPVSSQPIYMPTIVSTRGVQKVSTDKDGKFWFTNLKPGTYEIRASFAEEMKLENSMIVVKPGEVTKVDIILNVKLKSTKTKY
ncbi:caspase family protein [Leptospira sp. GIMC2001]|uniref:caspase family protein n=1 Tax=Leptospira sp. GIMC2001 TaxID=1513297 RepID=UPI00234A92C3|nr:caspase family protein [Leptospira sp. GIMC2001]WCL48819.1 caspase family protein [Leptospira sp. GIMC2001]